MGIVIEVAAGILLAAVLAPILSAMAVFAFFMLTVIFKGPEPEPREPHNYFKPKP